METEEQQKITEKMSANPTSLPRIPASINKRFLNFLIDWYLEIILTVLFALLIGYFLDLFHVQFLLSHLNMLTQYFIGAIITITYYTFFETLFKKSPAKFITKTRVLMKNGTLPSFINILIRSICRLIPFEFFSFLYSKNPEGWHDHISQTIVIDEQKNEKATTPFVSLLFLFLAEYIGTALLFGLIVVVPLWLFVYSPLHDILKENKTISPTIGTTNPPDAVVSMYYQHYMACLKNQEVRPTGSPQQGCQYNQQGLAIPSLTDKIQQARAQGFDLVLCAQNTPREITYDKAVINSKSATTKIYTHWGNSPIQTIAVGLEREQNQWKLSSITCPQKL